MSIVTLIFAIVFVVPLIAFFVSIVWKDKSTRKIGIAVISALVVFAIIVAYFVNKDK